LASFNAVMSSVNDAISGATDSGRLHTRINGRTPVFLICSPRPRVGKTLIARLLTEFFRFDGRSAAAFDTSPSDASLSHYLPECTVLATISDIKNQMALFDQLIVNDARPKIIDLAAGLFDPFLALIRDIGFLEEASKQSVSPLVLFVADRHQVSSEAYQMIWRWIPESLLVPVHNQAIMAAWHYGNFPTRRANGVPLRIPCLPWTLNNVVNKRDFSFTKFLDTPDNVLNELREWINRSFVAFRELQLSILIENFRPLFSRGCTQRDAHSEVIRRDGAGYHLSSGAQGGPDGKQAPLQAGPPDAVQTPLSEL
jgi:hypothetical protein